MVTSSETIVVIFLCCCIEWINRLFWCIDYRSLVFGGYDGIMASLVIMSGAAGSCWCYYHVLEQHLHIVNNGRTCDRLQFILAISCHTGYSLLDSKCILHGYVRVPVVQGAQGVHTGGEATRDVGVQTLQRSRDLGDGEPLRATGNGTAWCRDSGW